MQQAFVDALAQGATSATDAARLAGYGSARVAAHRMMKAPHIRDAVRNERARVLGTMLAPRAFKVLADVLASENARDADKLKAAAIVLDHVRRDDAVAPTLPAKPTSEMSLAELEAFVRAAAERMNADGSPR